MNSITTSSNTTDTSFYSPQFFSSFLEKRSWEPGWLADYRKDSWDKFLSLPDRKLKEEKWRFSPRARFDFSKFNQLTESPKEAVLNSDLQEGVFFDSLNKTILGSPSILSELPNLVGPDLGSNNNFLLGCSLAEAGLVLSASRNFVGNKPFICNHFSPTGKKSLFQQNFIFLEPFAELTLIENFESECEHSAGMLSNICHIILGENAKLNRIVIQKVNSQSTFHHQEKVELHKNAQFNNISLHLGAAQSRIESKGVVAGEGAEFNNFSLSLGHKEQLFDQRTVQHHVSPNGKSNLLFKNALLDQSKSIFSGLIKVEPNAQNTDAFQTNRNLLLSAEAEADSLPGLEILANEVKCSHGATTSKIDDQELFYLLSRGIPKKVSEKLIVLGFFDEVIRQAKDDGLIANLRDEISKFFI